MSYCKDFGKDKVIFVSKEDHETPSKVSLPHSTDDEVQGLILPNGEINWSCPCLGGMATGPCGPEFREAFSCFHYSTAEPKGSDCIEKFQDMQECMTKYPRLYPVDDDKELLDDNTKNDSMSSSNTEENQSNTDKERTTLKQ
ncbi:mitochondrial intermembrane space import and assembly protein 40-B-like [Limulus polyphemus]|uniref:Mitochondrial intermembrane space import and assembly protein 40-B-like n=1 Tax=Limulus polyphemus TaxID=6850 RepID=A0ABM1BJ61_LIMPO|nr:mitochondrial intermembrane space import and assembly protein 40-B-like [Limulus polyphemus]